MSKNHGVVDFVGAQVRTCVTFLIEVLINSTYLFGDVLIGLRHKSRTIVLLKLIGTIGSVQ